MRTKSITLAVIGIIIIATLCVLFVHIYFSSPGYTTREGAKEFYLNRPQCSGVEFLLNRQATYADSPGINVCIGFLTKSIEQD